MIASLRARLLAPRGLAWLGGLFIAVIMALATLDIVRGYYKAVDTTGQELDAHARTIAEQTARAFQAIDVQLRQLAQQYRRGTLFALSDSELRAYLKEYAEGLVQIEGLLVIKADGHVRASSYMSSAQEAGVNVSGRPLIQMVRSGPTPSLVIATAERSRFDGKLMFPMARRLETPGGEFDGLVGARGRIGYFEDFYRDIKLDEGTRIVLMHQNGTLIARHPRIEKAIGQHFPLFDKLLAAHLAGQPPTLRTVSPIDGVDRFGALRLVPEYPLAIIVTRDASVALAPWRMQSMRTALRTFALSVLAALLLAVTIRQLSRLNAARRSLEASQERFAAAVAGSDDGIWDWDYASKQAFASPRARELMGLLPGPETQPDQEWFDAVARQIHPDDAPLRTQAIRAHLAGQAPAYECDYRVRNPDGSYRWVRVRGMCVRREGEEPHRMAGSISDIDAAKRAEEALRKSEERFALAVAGSNDGILDWDVVNDRMFISKRAMQMLGVASDVEERLPNEPDCAVSGMRFRLNSEAAVRSRSEWATLVQFHPEDAQSMADDFRWVFEGKSDVREGEYRVRHPDGGYRWIRIRGMLVRDGAGKPVRWAGSISDIDAAKRAEEALRKSEERFALAVSGSNDGIVDWDVVNDRMYSSERAMQILGIESGVTVRTRAQWTALVKYHPDDVQRMMDDLNSFLEGHTELRDGEYRVLLPNGKYRWIRHRNKCVRDTSGRPIRVAGSVSDIDPQKRAEQERLRLEGQLLQAKKLEAIGTLAGGIAHDFNNILAAILGYGEMAQKEAAEGTPIRRHIDAVVGAGLRAKSLVERILAFSRSGMGERKPVHVQSVVDEALDLTAASMPDNIRIERRLATGDAAVMGDPTQFHQVVMNLCANGAQAMKSGGTLSITLDVVEKSGTMAATSTLAAGHYVRLCVRDTGTGIEPQLMGRIFDPFFTTKDVGVGTGLGLSLVHGIVTDLGGGIDVESRPGEGAAFTIYLPLSQNIAEPVGIEESIPYGSGETVLLVDDEEALVCLGEEMIAGLGYEPVGFKSSVAALKAFRAAPQRFSVLLSDETMPEMTGSELIRAVHAIRPDLPVVLMSGFVSSALLARARELGVTEVLSKPVVVRDIARSLAHALRQQVRNGQAQSAETGMPPAERSAV